MHISLADLMKLDGSSALLQEWTAGSGRSGPGTAPAPPPAAGGGGAWLDGDAAEAVACDAAMVPFVTGDVDPGALEDLVRLCVQLDRLRHDPRGGAAGPDGAARRRRGRPAGSHRPRHRRRPGQHRLRPGRGGPGYRPGVGGPRARDHRQGGGPAVGPGRAGELPAAPAARRPAGRAEPAAGHRVLASRIPAGIRNAVTLRDQHCQWAGGCDQPASACEVHHVKHKKNGGTTSTKDCVLLCFFHHQIVIHKWGWTLVLNPDGTTTAWNPGKTKVLHSHGPPARPG